MIIGINEKHEIIFRASGAVADTIAVDESTHFLVDDIPHVGVNEKLLFNPETKAFYTVERSLVDAAALEASRKQVQERTVAKKTQNTVRKWLNDNDWKVNKHTLGEWADDDPRWLTYLAERAEKRAAYEAAEAILQMQALPQ